ncbi:hypothetical protein P7C70_g888, partial [Phenoliferia sp. Uapishka_3]
PTQPISISTRTAQTREADRPTTKKSGGNQGSVLAKSFAPILQSEAAKMGRMSGSGVKNTVRLNPSKPGKRSVGLADQARRWASIFIRHSNDNRAVNWVSITRGACLPLTTDFLPTAEDQAKNYSDYRYSVPTNSTSTSFLLRTDIARRSAVLELITELISQRLSHGFQICTPANALGALDEINLATSKTISDVLRDMDLGEMTAIYLSLSSQIHRISYERRTQSVVVKILRRRHTWAKDPYQYGALVWTHGSKKFNYDHFSLPYPSMIEPADWQHLDRLVAGDVKDDMRGSLRFWRTRLVLLPAESVPDREYLISKTPVFEGGDVTDEDIQYQGFLTLMSLIQSVRWVPPGSEREVIDVQTTTKFAPEWATEMGGKALQQAEDAAHGGTAAQRSSRWLRRMTSVQPNSREESLGSNPATTERDRSPSPTRTGSAGGDTTPTPLKARPTVHMTYSVVLDLDMQRKSDRAERVLCHYDRSHNSQAAYHIELTWLAGSGKIIDNTIQSWTRQVARWGLSLVEVSTRAVDSTHNPFQRATQVPLVVAPPPLMISLPHRDYYEAGLLSHLGFFLDLGADDTFPEEVDVQYSYRRNATNRSQYIHRSGTLLVSILGGKEGFNYVPNRIFVSHSPGKTTVEDVVAELESLCGDAERLEKLWKELAPAVKEERVGGSLGGKSWTGEERETLRRAVGLVDPDAASYATEKAYWESVAKNVAGRSSRGCESQWNKMKETCTTPTNPGSPQLTRLVWSEEEVKRLVSLVKGNKLSLQGQQLVDKMGTGRTPSAYVDKWRRIRPKYIVVLSDDEDDGEEDELAGDNSNSDVKPLPTNSVVVAGTSSSSNAMGKRRARDFTPASPPAERAAKVARNNVASPIPQAGPSGEAVPKTYVSTSSDAAARAEAAAELAVRRKYDKRIDLKLSEEDINRLKNSIINYDLERLRKKQEDEMCIE